MEPACEGVIVAWVMAAATRTRVAVGLTGGSAGMVWSVASNNVVGIGE